MAKSVAEKRAAFVMLHRKDCFVIPNPWDVGSALMLQSLGFKALASTSSGMAWSQGRPDGGVPVEGVLEHLTTLAAAVDIPLNADFQDGYAADAEGVAANVRRAVATGIAGLSIEDSVVGRSEPLYPLDEAVARIAAARAAIDETDTTVMLTGRSEGFIRGRPDLAETIRRLQAYEAAGADCLYAPGLRTEAEIATVRAAVRAPVNVLVSTPEMTVAGLAALGVRRVSVGGALARSAWGGFMRAAQEIATAGTFTRFAEAAAGADLNRQFQTPQN